MATSFAVRWGSKVSRSHSKAIVVRTLYIQWYSSPQRQARLRLPHRLLTVTAAESNAKSSTGELFQPTDVLTDASSRGSEAASDIASQAASTVTPDIVDLSSVGLGGYWPPGLIQSALELIHNHAHLPWWACIVTLTVTLRLAVLPVMVKMQRVGATIANLNKDAQVLHARIQECKAAGDKIGESQAGIEIMKLYQKHNAHPLQMIPLAFAQVPLFLSMLYGLRGMAELPLESLRTGGMLWFTDLVIPDPLFALPLVACGSFLVNIEVGFGDHCYQSKPYSCSNLIRKFFEGQKYYFVCSLVERVGLPLTTSCPLDCAGSCVLVLYVSCPSQSPSLP